MNKMTVLLMCLFFTPIIHAENSDIASILESNQFDLHYTTSSFDADLWKAFSAVEQDVFMANPNAPANFGCMRVPGLPSKALVFGGKSKPYQFILYMEGGFAVNYNLVVFQKKNGKVEPIWRGIIMNGALQNFTDVKTALHEKKFVVRQLRYNQGLVRPAPHS